MSAIILLYLKNSNLMKQAFTSSASRTTKMRAINNTVYNKDNNLDSIEIASATLHMSDLLQ